MFWALGLVIGLTEEVGMLTYRQKFVVRIRVGIMKKDLLPITTDVVFGKEGYNITLSLEPKNFELGSGNLVLQDQHDKDDNGKEEDDMMGCGW